MRVLVTGGRAPATLELVRMLHRRGHVVHAAECIGGTLTSYSRAVTGHHRVRAPVTSPEGFVSDLVALVQRHAIDVVVPTCEEALWVAWGREPIARHADVATFEGDVAVRLHGKSTFAQLVSDLGWRVPETRRVTRRDDLIDAAHGSVVLKPEFSRFGTSVRLRPAPPGRGTSEDERFWREVQVDDEHPWVAQEFLEGPQVSSWSVVRDGRVVAHAAYPATFTASFAHRRRHQPDASVRSRAPAGATVSFTSATSHAPEDAPLLALARAVATHVGGSGMLAFDAVVVDGVPVPIECNPRLTSGVHLFHAHPDVADLLVGAGDLPGVPLQPPVTARASLPFALALYGPSQVLHGSASFRAWLKALASRDATFWWRDPLPTLLQPWVLGVTYARAARRREGILRSTTTDIAWNGGVRG